MDTMDIMEDQQQTPVIAADISSAEAPSTTETDTVCHLLRLPTEIRLSIYRYLLLPRTSINLEHVASRHKVNAIEIEDEWVDEQTDSDDGWSGNGCVCGMCDSDNDSDSDMDDDLEEDVGHNGCICGHCNEDSSDGEWDDDETDYSLDPDEPASKMHFEVLRVNRQIYQEASALFYSEAQLVLGMDDILCLMNSRRPRHYPAPFFLMFDMDPPDNVIWRHDPLKGIGKQDKNGVVKYRSPKLAGRLDPHVFARFQKLQLEICYDEDYVAPDFEIWIDDDTFEFNQGQAAEYVATIQRSTLIKDLVKIVSNSHNITHLSIQLEAEIAAISLAIKRADEMDDMDMDSDDDDEVDDDERQAIEDKSDKTQYAANERAAELVVNSELFNPLLSLSNVKNFNFGFDFIHREPNDPPFQPQSKTVQKIASMKTVIESQYEEPVLDISLPKESIAAWRVTKRKGKGKGMEKKGKEYGKGKNKNR